MSTFKAKFNKKHGFPADKSHSVASIAKISGFKKSVLDAVYRRGVGARKTNPASVRSATTGKKVGGKSLAGKMSANQWAMARVYGFVGGNPKQVAKGAPDHDLWLKRK
jgi:hypothetical protein